MWAVDYFTLVGMQGDISLEASIIMRAMMQTFGLWQGLFIEKSLVYLFAVVLAAITFKGIDNKSNWVFYLALTSYTKRWMRAKKRFVVAFLPIYLAALVQAFAALSWVYLIYFL